MDPQLVQQLMQLIQQYGGLGRTGGSPGGFSGFMPQGQASAGQMPSAASLPSSQPPPNTAAQPNLGQQVKQQFNPQRLLSTPAAGGLQGMGIQG